MVEPKFSRIADDGQSIRIEGRHYRMRFDQTEGKFSQITVFDGITWHEILAKNKFLGDNLDIPAAVCKIIEKDSDYLRIEAVRESSSWRIETDYEVFASGYVVCSFKLEALADQVRIPPLAVEVPLDEAEVFSNKYQIKNLTNDPDARESVRGVALDFSTDSRPVTNSIDFLLEHVTMDMNGRPCRKFLEEYDEYRILGWKLNSTSVWQYPYPKGYRYENRWGFTVTSLNNSANKVRAQRIYHYYGNYPILPGDEMLEEMAEYGCSILALHTQTFIHASGNDPIDSDALRRLVEIAHKHNIKVIFYCQPYLLSIESPLHNELGDCRTDGLRMWYALQDSQLIFYEPHTRLDADELCLRCEKAYTFIVRTILACWEKYKFDGLYMDWCWPTQCLCSNWAHNHKPGLFNFYDYLRMIRDLRKAIGPEDIMIGHGGGFLVASDFVESFDACLTGEAQKETDPTTIGCQYGTAPALWTIQRFKHDEFRSDTTIEQYIKQGLTPHYGVGITGTAVIATLDPAHHIRLLGLWQIWRAFPVSKAKFYNYLTEKVIESDNHEVFYSLYLTAEKEMLLILVNAGGPEYERTPGIGVNVRINADKLALPAEMNCWRMKGNTYETFRIAQVEPVKNGEIRVPELGLHEFMGFVLTPDKPPHELVTLAEHLKGRPERMAKIIAAKQKRLMEFDKQMDQFAKSPIAAATIKYDEFMIGRAAE